MALGGGGNTLGLIFKIKADGTEKTKADIRSLRSEFNKEVNDIKSGGTDAFLSIGKAAGLSTDQIASFKTGALAAVGAVTAITGAITAATVALFGITKQTAEFGDKLWNAHLKTSASVETISALEFAGQQAGLTLEQISNGLVRFTNNLGQADAGNKKFKETFEQLGVKSFKDTDKALSEFLTHFSQLRTDQEKTLAASQVFGVRMGATFVQLFDQTGGDIDAFKAKVKEMGLLWTTEEAQMANNFDDLYNQVTRQLGGLTRQLAIEVMPIFRGFFTVISNSLKENKDDWQRWGTIIEDVLGGVLTAVVALGKFINESVASWKGALLGVLSIASPAFGAMRFLMPGGFMDQASKELVQGMEAFKQSTPSADATRDYHLPSAGGKQKKDQTAKRNFEAELAELKNAIGERESAYKEETTRLKSEYDQRLRSFDEYIAAEKTAADNRLKDVTTQLEAEEAKVQEGLAKKLITEAEFITKSTNLQKEKTAAINQRLTEESKLEAEAYKHKMELERRYYEEAKALRDKKTSDTIADLNQARELELEDAEWHIGNLRQRLEKQLQIELYYNDQIQKARLEQLDRDRDRLYQEIRAIAEHYAEVKHITIEEAMQSDVVREALAERAKKIEAIEYERRRVIKETTDDNIKAYRDEARAAFDAANAAAAGASRPRRVGGDPHNPFDSLMKSVSSGQFTAGFKVMENGVKQFASVAEVAFSAVGTVVNGLAQGVGNLVQQWVLMGTAGPNAIRKMVASVLAGLASQAAVQALMFLAYGIAALTPWGAALYGPAAPWFKAAAIMGAVALTAGVVGRVVAGNSFQESSGGSGGSSSNNSVGASSSQQGLQPISIGRAVGPPTAAGPKDFQHTIEFKVKGGVIVDEFVRDYMLNGKTRIIVTNDGTLAR